MTIAAGSRRASISLPIQNDGLSEATEAFVVSILTIDSGTLSAPRTTRVNILDDENPVVVDPEPPLVSNYEVTEVPLLESARPISLEFMPGNDDILFFADQIGRVWTYNLETNVRQRFINLSDQVNFGQGLQSMALHPNFPEQPYVYVYYSVDPPDSADGEGFTARDGDGNRFQYLVRIEADPAFDYLRAVPGSQTVLLGGAAQSLDDISGGGEINFSAGEIYADRPASDQINLSPAEIAAGLEYRQNLIKGDGNHIGGGMAFGPDGNLYLAIGDNAAFNFADPRAFSVQDVDSLNGKVVRIDPITGRGLTDNPFYQPGDSLNLNSSKVFQYGLRNPFSISFANDGRLVIADTGHTSYEEINIGAPGANFGWPFYEGADFDGLNIPPNFREGVAPIRFIEGPDGYIYYVDILSDEIGRLEITEIRPEAETMGAVLRAENVDEVAQMVSYGAGVNLANPVLFSSVGHNGRDPVTVEFIDIGSNSARFFLQEPDYFLDGQHRFTETVSPSGA